MTVHASHVSPLARRLIRPDCPQCGDHLIASTVSVHVNDNHVRHWWSCDSCGHEFMTAVKVLRGRVIAQRAAFS